MKRIFRIVVLCCIASATVAGQAATGDESAQGSTVDAETSAPVLQATTLEDRGAALAEREEVIWLSNKLHWMVTQPARTAARGSVLLLAEGDTSANGNSHLASLRQQLPSFGWHTYFLNLPADADITALLGEARAQMQTAPAQLLACEGEACLRLVRGGVVHGGGTVYINLPMRRGFYVAGELAEAWSKAAPPALLLQEQPHIWPEVMPLDEDFELHLLPRSQAGHGSLVQRTLRGWLKRRLQAG